MNPANLTANRVRTHFTKCLPFESLGGIKVTLIIHVALRHLVQLDQYYYLHLYSLHL